MRNGRTTATPRHPMRHGASATGVPGRLLARMPAARAIAPRNSPGDRRSIVVHGQRDLATGLV